MSNFRRLHIHSQLKLSKKFFKIQGSCTFSAPNTYVFLPVLIIQREGGPFSDPKFLQHVLPVKGISGGAPLWRLLALLGSGCHIKAQISQAGGIEQEVQGSPMW